MGVVESSSSYRTPAMPPPCGLPSRLKNISSFSAQITVGGQAANPSEDVFRLSARKKKNLPRPQGGGSEGMTNNLFQTWPTHSYTDTHCQHRHWYYTHKQTTHGHIHTRYMQTKVPCRLKSILKPIIDCWTICFPLTSLKFQIASEIVFKISQCRAREPQTCTRFFFWNASFRRKCQIIPLW